MLANLTMTEVVPTFPARFTETDGRRIPPKLWHHLTPSPLAMPSPDKTQHRPVYMYSRYQRTGYGVKEWWVMIINATEHQWSVLFRSVYSVMSKTLTALVYKAFESNTYMHINVYTGKMNSSFYHKNSDYVNGGYSILIAKSQKGIKSKYNWRFNFFFPHIKTRLNLDFTSHIKDITLSYTQVHDFLHVNIWLLDFKF